MTKFTYEVSYTEYASGLLEANNEEDAEYILDQDFNDFEDYRLINLEEVVD